MPTSEEREPAPLSPYGASKWAAEAYVKTWSLAGGRAQRGGAARQRVRAPPEPARRGGRGGDLQPPAVRGRAPEAVRARQAHEGLRVRGRRGARAARGGGQAGTYNVATGVETDVTSVWNALREVRGREHRAGAGRPAPGRAPAQPPGRQPRRARAGLARGGGDRGGAAQDLRGAGGGVRGGLIWGRAHARGNDWARLPRHSAWAKSERSQYGSC